MTGCDNPLSSASSSQSLSDSVSESSSEEASSSSVSVDPNAWATGESISRSDVIKNLGLIADHVSPTIGSVSCTYDGISHDIKDGEALTTSIHAVMDIVYSEKDGNEFYPYLSFTSLTESQMGSDEKISSYTEIRVVYSEVENNFTIFQTVEGEKSYFVAAFEDGLGFYSQAYQNVNSLLSTVSPSTAMLINTLKNIPTTPDVESYSSDKEGDLVSSTTASASGQTQVISFEYKDFLAVSFDMSLNLISNPDINESTNAALSYNNVKPNTNTDGYTFIPAEEPSTWTVGDTLTDEQTADNLSVLKNYVENNSPDNVTYNVTKSAMNMETMSMDTAETKIEMAFGAIKDNPKGVTYLNRVVTTTSQNLMTGDVISTKTDEQRMVYDAEKEVYFYFFTNASGAKLAMKYDLASVGSQLNTIQSSISVDLSAITSLDFEKIISESIEGYTTSYSSSKEGDLKLSISSEATGLYKATFENYLPSKYEVLPANEGSAGYTIDISYADITVNSSDEGYTKLYS